MQHAANRRDKGTNYICNYIVKNKKSGESWEDKRKTPIFATSMRGIRRKDDNLYGLRVVSSPNHTSHHSSELMALFFLQISTENITVAMGR